MKRLIIFLIFGLLAFTALPQIQNVAEFRIQNATTAFGVSVPVGTKIYDIETGNYYVVISGLSSTATITTGAASLTQLNTDDQTLSLVTNSLSISGGNSVDLSPYLDNTDDQVLSLNGMILGIEDGNTVDLSSVQDGYEANTDNQTLSFSFPNLSILNGNSVDLSSLQDGTGTDDQAGAEVPIADAGGYYDGSDVEAALQEIGADIASSGDNWGSQSVISDASLTGTGVTGDPLSVDNTQISITESQISDFGAYLTSEVDGSPTNELQTIDVSQLSGTNLELSLSNDGEVTKIIDLSPLQDGTGTDNQQLSLTTNTLSLEDGGSVDLSSYLDNTDAQTLSFTSPTLSIAGGNSVNLSALQDGTGTDDQTLSLVTNTLSIEDGNSVDLSAYMDADDWGAQTVVSDATLTGTGVAGDALSVNGDNIEVPLDNVYTSTTGVGLGYLYNHYAVTDSRNISSSDSWVVPTTAHFSTLATALGGTSVAGGEMKEVGTTYWDSPNTGATNSSEYNARAGGYRSYTDGNFNSFRQRAEYWTTTEDDLYPGQYEYAIVWYNSTGLSINTSTNPKDGISIRLVKTSTILSDGETGTYIGNDGKVYNTICIGTQEWLSENLLETQYRDNSSISEVADAATWMGLTTGARCAYNNNEENATSASIVYGFTEVDGDPTNEIQTLDVAQLTGTNLELSLSNDGEATHNIDLSSLQDGYEANTDDQVIDVFSLSGTDLQLSLESDGEATKTVDLSSLQDGTGTDDQTASEVSVIVQNGIEQNNVQLELEAIREDLAAGGDGWGSDVVNTNATLSGDGTSGNPLGVNSITVAKVSDFDTEVANNTAVAANTAKTSNATHTGEVTGSEALTVTDNVIGYDNIDETLKQAITDNDGSFDWMAAGQINCSISSATTFSFSNIAVNKNLKIKLVISSSATVAWNSTPLDLRGDAISGDGTYLINLEAWGTTEGDIAGTVRKL